MADRLDDLRSALATAETPRPPDAAFSARLRAELVSGTDDVLHELTAAHPRRNARPPRALVLAAAAVVVIAVGLVAWQRSDTALTTTPATRPPSTFPVPDLEAGRRACVTFRDTAFAPRLRNDVVRHGNTTALSSAAEIADAVARLETARTRLDAELSASGFGRETVRRPLDRIGSRARATSRALDAARLDLAREELRKVDDHLVQLTAALGSLGLLGCL